MRNIIILFCLILLLASCKDNNERHTDTSQSENQSTLTSASDRSTTDIEKIKNRLCNEFPKNLVMTHNPHAIKLDIESVDNGSGGILGCKLKLFYGDKDYEYSAGEITAWVNQQKDPFWQYNPDRNPTLYQTVEDLGEKAVFIGNMFQLHVLKDGILYSITPPNNGSRTDTGKATKEIAIEIAQHYKL